jgi:hypothetical protein
MTYLDTLFNLAMEVPLDRDTQPVSDLAREVAGEPWVPVLIEDEIRERVANAVVPTSTLNTP